MLRESHRPTMLSVAAAVFCLLSFLVVPAQTRRATRNASSSGQTGIVDIRQIDFRNFSYDIQGKSYKLRDGFYAENVAAGVRWELGLVDGPFYGDLTGDGKDEAVFVLSHGQPEAVQTAEARVYTLRGGRAVLISTLIVKEAVNCVLDHYVRVTDGMIILERVYAKQARCDYNEITEYRWNGSVFAPMGASMRMPCRCM
ncbi:MAG TPA: hypothetical protein VJS44_12130 [Pyrinomonadaceae bacterium]|nr:hypothetical protein [Pyrinomonadaceae bacterium]